MDIKFLNELQFHSYEFGEKLRKSFGLLSPEEVSDVDYPIKQPIYDDHGIILYNCAGSEYFIAWSELENPVDALLFIHHLCDKVWIHRRNIQFIITIAGEKFGWGYLKNKD